MNNDLSEESEILTDSKFYQPEDVTPKDLLTIALIFITAMFVKLFSKDLVVFESCKTILAPIATLVIGFYFGKTG